MSVYESYEDEASQWETSQYEDENAYETAFETWETNQGEEETSLGAELNEALGELAGELVGESPFSEVQETELANELLEISSEEELEEFLGKIVRGVGKFARSGLGKALLTPLKSIAKTVLPVAAGALGNLIVPGAGGLIGTKLGTMATKLFEVELETIGEEEAQFEVARRFVRLAGTAAAQAAHAPRSAPPEAVARAALITAARRQAPGLVPILRRARWARPGPGRRPAQRWRGRPRPGYAYGTYGPSAPSFDDAGNGAAMAGRWVRKGRKIVLYGA